MSRPISPQSQELRRFLSEQQTMGNSVYFQDLVQKFPDLSERTIHRIRGEFPNLLRASKSLVPIKQKTAIATTAEPGENKNPIDKNDDYQTAKNLTAESKIKHHTEIVIFRDANGQFAGSRSTIAPSAPYLQKLWREQEQIAEEGITTYPYIPIPDDFKSSFPALPARFRPLIETRRRYKVLRSGRSGGKTTAAALAVNYIIAGQAQNYGWSGREWFLVIRKAEVSIEESIAKSILDCADDLNYRSTYHEKLSPKEITSQLRGRVTTHGMYGARAQKQRIKGKDKVDVAILEEAQEHSSLEDLEELIDPTIKKEGSEIWIIYNPEDRTTPVHRFIENIRASRPEDLLEIDCDYRDNAFISEVNIKSAEQMKKISFEDYENVWLGKTREHSTSKILARKVGILPAHEMPPIESLDFGIVRGLDFGSKCAYVEWGLKDQNLYCYNEFCIVSNTSILALQKYLHARIPKPERDRAIITADSEDRTAIAILKNEGFLIRPCMKPAGSVRARYDFLTNNIYKIYVSDACPITAHEMTSIEYERDRATGVYLPTPPLYPTEENGPWHDHTIDAGTYALQDQILDRRGPARIL